MKDGIASFRDPAGTCSIVQGRVLRRLNSESAQQLEAFLRTASARAFAADGRMVSTRRLDPGEELALNQAQPCSYQSEPGRLPASGRSHSGAGNNLGGAEGAVFEHERVHFPSYPYEWPPEMLWAAGRLTLELCRASLVDGFGLKDASPYNILFRGPEPVFIDVPSFERRVPGDPLWKPYGQFVRTFLLPLLAHRRWGVPLADIFGTRRDGLEPAEVYRYCSGLERLTPQVLSLVSMPAWLGRRAQARGEKLYEPRPTANAEKAAFILGSLLNRLERKLDALAPGQAGTSRWSGYMRNHRGDVASCGLETPHASSYSPEAFAAKERFVAEALSESNPRCVLDVGANNGYFSLKAARSGATVVAIDTDPACVGAIFRQAQAQKANILPLVVDLARPTSAMGWRNTESLSFLDRAAGSFDCVMMLAVIHHLLVMERIPLGEIVDLAADLCSAWALIEYVGPEDAMFRRLVRGRGNLYAGLSAEAFEAAWAARFEIRRSLALAGTHRRLYLLKLKPRSC